MKVHCPYCMNPVTVSDDETDPEIPCPACGSSIERSAIDETQMWSLPPTARSLGRFQLVERLGVGAFGTVYLADDPELQRQVAIKVPRTSDLTSAADLKLFLHEARSVSRLVHRGIVTVYETGTHNGVPFIVSEYVRGITLADRLSSGRMEPRESARIVAEVADSLQFAHEQGVVHRDIKPGNIMLEADGRPRLMDFGLAKRESGEATITSDGQLLGTPAYMSPEQATGHSHEVDGRSDVYSLGVVLYRLLTNEMPFRGNRRMLIHQVLNEDPRPPRALNDRLPSDLETITLKAMEKEPSKRYQTAGQFADDLRRWLDNAPILARPMTRAERAWRWCRRNSTAAALVATVAMLLIVVSFLSTVAAIWKESVAQREAALRRQAEVERRRAQATARESNRRLVQLHVADGLRLAEQGDTAGSLVWLDEAMRLDASLPDDGGADRLRMHRIRFGSLLRSCPRFSRIIFSGGAVLHAVFSPDGGRLATADGDHTARVWELSSGKPITEPLQHDDRVNHVAFSADGRSVVTASHDGTARIWGIDSGAISPPLEHRAEVLFAEFSPDGRQVVTAGADDEAIVWNARSAEVRLRFKHADKVRMGRFSPDGDKLLTVCDDGAVRCWDARTGVEITAAMRHEARVGRACFNPSGTRIVSSGDDATARIWDASTGDPVTEPLRHHAAVQDAVFSPDGSLVATASNDSTARLWHAESGLPVSAPLQHEKEVKLLDFSPDGLRLVTAGNSQVARIWDVPSGASTGLEFPHNEDLTSARFSPDGRSLLTSGWGRTVRVWAITPEPPAFRTIEHSSFVNQVAFRPDGGALATAGSDGTAKVWDATTLDPLMTLEHPFSVSHLVFSSGGDLLLTACQEEARAEMRLWDAEGELLRSIEIPAPYDVRFSPDDKRIVAALSDHTARVWDVESGKPLGEPLRHDDVVYRASFSPSGSRILTTSFDKSARLWDAESLEQLGRLDHLGRVDAAVFSPDERWIATACSAIVGGGYAQVWDADSLRPVNDRLAHSAAYVFCVSFSADGGKLLTAGSDNAARIWNPATGTQIVPTLKHQAPIQWAAFDSRGRMVVTAGWDSMARVWDASNGLPLTVPVLHGNWVMCACFSPDGRFALTGSRGGTARLIDLRPTDLSAGRMRLVAELLSARRLDASGSLNRIDATKLREIWGALGANPRAYTAKDDGEN